MKNQYSHLTAKSRDKISFPMNWLKRLNLLKGEILDFGCGHGFDVEFLKKLNFQIIGFDPYYFNELDESKKYDTITCLYVLNVVETLEQSKILMKISSLLKNGGVAYFAVRRDIKYEGFRNHYLHKKPTYQTKVILPFESIFKNESCEIYKFQHYNNLPKPTSDCIFCNVEREVYLENALGYVIFDKYPVSKGQSLIIPKRHVADYFETSLNEKISLQLLLEEAQKTIKAKFNPEGFNIGVNIGNHAGQTVNHVHIHLIPRYENDVPDPIGGVRNIIPGKGNYLRNK